jgi:hypothetical protein
MRERGIDKRQKLVVYVERQWFVPVGEHQITNPAERHHHRSELKGRHWLAWSPPIKKANGVTKRLAQIVWDCFGLLRDHAPCMVIGQGGNHQSCIE